MNYNVREDVIVSGHLIPETHLFFLGGFLMEESIIFSTSFFLYAYKKDCKQQPVHLIKNWNQIFENTNFEYKPVLFKWKYTSSNSEENNSYCFNYMLEAYYLDGTPMNKYLGYNRLIGGLFLSEIGSNLLDFNFNPNNSLYDWNDGTYRIQSWNIMTRDPLNEDGKVINFKNRSTIKIIDGDSELFSGITTTKKDTTLNFVPIPVKWITKSGETEMDYKNSLFTQQCYRYWKVGEKNEMCDLIPMPYAEGEENYISMMGATTNNLANKSNFIPFFVSNLGCGEKMISNITHDTLGLLINSENNYGNLGDGYCIRNLSNKFEFSLYPPGFEYLNCPDCSKITDFPIKPNFPIKPDCHKCPECPKFDCKNCTSSNCVNLCDQVINDPGCRNNICGKCNPVNCKSSFEGYVKADDNLKFWMWGLIGFLCFLVILLLFFLSYKSSDGNILRKKIQNGSFSQPKKSSTNIMNNKPFIDTEKTIKDLGYTSVGYNEIPNPYNN